MRLNRKYLDVYQDVLRNNMVGPLNDMPEKVIQFGEGNFLRAFVDWHFNELNKKELFNGKIVVVQPMKEGMINLLNEQDGLYTLLQRGIKNGKQIEKTEIITAISRGINPYTDWNEYLKCAENPELRFIVSNTTEAGISYSEAPMPVNECPVSFPAKVTALLYERFKYFKGAHEKGMIIIPCELIENNGATLKSCVTQHAQDWKLGNEFLSWLENSNYFFNTLVDRIVPGYPRDEIAAITEKIGYEDKAIVSAEVLHLWVIEGNEKVNHELPFEKAGLNVVWTNDITPYRTLKVRILNGCHTLMTIPSYLAGKRTVKESVEDEVTGDLVKEGLFNEVLPTLDFAEEKKIEFANAVIERFQNPFIKHYLQSITLNSISKFKVRVLPSLLKYYEIFNEFPAALTFSLAALIVFYKGYNGKNNNPNGKWREETYIIQDDEEILSFFDNINKQNDENPETMVKKILGNKNFWDTDLNSYDGLTERILNHYVTINQIGMKAAIEELTDSQLTK